ncbi:hypothetical protein ACLUWY_08750 [Limosilactobacillus mucosae]
MQIQLDKQYFVTSDCYNPAILFKIGVNSKGKTFVVKRWYCGRKLSAALAEYIKQTGNDNDEIKTMQAYAAHVDHTEQRIAKLLKEGGFE